MIDPKLKNWIIIVVTSVWALNFLVGLVPQLSTRRDPLLNGIFMAIVGGLFALSERKKGKDDDDDDEPQIRPKKKLPPRSTHRKELDEVDDE